MHHTEYKEFPQRHHCMQNKRTSTLLFFPIKTARWIGVPVAQQIRIYTQRFIWISVLSFMLACSVSLSLFLFWCVNVFSFLKIQFDVQCFIVAVSTCFCAHLRTDLEPKQRNVWAVNILTPGHFNKITSKNYKRHFFSFLFELHSVIRFLFSFSGFDFSWITRCIQITCICYIRFLFALSRITNKTTFNSNPFANVRAHLHTLL